MQNSFRFFEDSGHGWLEVPIALCRELGLAHAITGYSYCKGDNLYLEEDCDAGTFVKAWEAATGKEWYVKRADGYYDRPNEKRVYHDGSSPVRNYLNAIPADLLQKPD